MGGSPYLTLKVKVKVAQSCPTLCNPMDYTAHGILQARILEWVAFPFSRGSSQPRDQTQVSLSITNFQSLLKLMSIESLMPSNNLILCFPLLFSPSIFPSNRVFFPMSQFFTSSGQTIGVSPSASVLPMNIQDRFRLGWTGWISLQSKGLSRVFSNTTIQKHQFFSAQLSSQSNSHPYMTTGKAIVLTRWTFVGKVMSLLFNMLSEVK